MPTSRRAVLLAAGGLVSGGALSGRAGAREASGPRSRRATTAERAERDGSRRQLRSVDTDFRLSADEHQSWELTLTGETTLAFDLIVRWGPDADLLVFEREEYQAYLNGYRARYIAGGSFFGTVDIQGGSVGLPGGEYAVVVDNTDWTRGIPKRSGGSVGGTGMGGGTSDEDESADESGDDADGGTGGGDQAIGVSFAFTATR